VLQSLKAAASPAPNGPDCIMNVERGACPGPTQNGLDMDTTCVVLLLP
jgi:hypothetical protein